MRKLLCVLTAFALLWTAGIATAETVRQEYDIVWMDEAGLVPEPERPRVENAMREAAGNGHMVFLTVDEKHLGSPEKYAQNCLNSLYGSTQSENATVFLIDLSVRVLTVQSTGRMKKVLTTGVSDSIMDNVYRLASGGDYAGCAESVFEQIAALERGEKIAQPMRLVGDILIAAVTGVLVAFLLLSGNRGRKNKKALKAVTVTVLSSSAAALLGSRLLRKVVHSSSSGGSGGGSGGGHSGGGFSGGSHGF